MSALLRLLDRLNGLSSIALSLMAGRDAGDVEPLHAVKRLVPVDIAGLCQRDGRIGTVVDDLARAAGSRRPRGSRCPCGPRR